MTPSSLDHDLPLRDDIRLFGRLLGETVRDQEGDATFAVIERIRQASVHLNQEPAAQAGSQHEAQREALDELLPQDWLHRLDLPGFAESLRALHHPAPDADPHALESREHPAWRRMKFEELLVQQLSLRRAYLARRARAAVALPARGQLTAALLASLPFRPTAAQARVQAEIAADLAAPHPMQRLLQGDVGSGKTLVAALAMLQAVENGW